MAGKKTKRGKPVVTGQFVSAKALGRYRRCLKLVKDQAASGLRADLHPTLQFTAAETAAEMASNVGKAYDAYLAKLDKSVCDRAATALGE